MSYTISLAQMRAEASNAFTDFYGYPPSNSSPLWDPFRHAFSSAYITASINDHTGGSVGSLIALGMGNIVELGSPNNFRRGEMGLRDMQMDLQNNEAGRLIGQNLPAGWTSGDIAAAVGSAINNGTLITSWQDPRTLVQMPQGNPMGDGWGGGIYDSVGTAYNNAQTPPRADPLILDLNGDGIVSHTALAQSNAYFDHDADGVATHTGWVGAGDGLLVFDKNGNGLIDNGSELFGDHFIKANGQYATDGFDALASLDTNHDGQFNAQDAAFNQVQVWKDLNGNGITDAGELQSLAAAGIANFNVTPTNTTLGTAAFGSNQTAAAGSYTTTAGTQSSMGQAMQDINLAQDTFHSQFLTSVPLTATAQTAALVMGSGLVRNTQEAASLATSEGAAFATALAGRIVELGVGTHAGQWAANERHFSAAA